MNIKKWTIADLSEGRVVVINDSCLKQLSTVLAKAFPLDKYQTKGTCKLYGKSFINEGMWTVDHIDFDIMPKVSCIDLYNLLQPIKELESTKNDFFPIY